MKYAGSYAAQVCDSKYILPNQDCCQEQGYACKDLVVQGAVSPNACYNFSPKSDRLDVPSSQIMTARNISSEPVPTRSLQ